MLIERYRTDNGSAFKTSPQTSISAAIPMNTFRDVKEIKIFTVTISHEYVPGGDDWNLLEGEKHSACL